VRRGGGRFGSRCFGVDVLAKRREFTELRGGGGKYDADSTPTLAGAFEVEGKEGVP